MLVLILDVLAKIKENENIAFV